MPDIVTPAFVSIRYRKDAVVLLSQQTISIVPELDRAVPTAVVVPIPPAKMHAFGKEVGRVIVLEKLVLDGVKLCVPH